MTRARCYDCGELGELMKESVVIFEWCFLDYELELTQTKRYVCPTCAIKNYGGATEEDDE